MTAAHAPAFSVGLTGGIGCGKTTVADMFGARGASLVDTDAIAHALTAPHGAAMPAILAEFGAGFATPEGALARPAGAGAVTAVAIHNFRIPQPAASSIRSVP